MKYMLVMRASEPAHEASQVEAGLMAMAAFEDRLARAGVLLAAERLDPGAFGMLAVWFLQVASPDEALEWSRRGRMPGAHLELCRVLGPDETVCETKAVQGAAWRHPEI